MADVVQTTQQQGMVPEARAALQQIRAAFMGLYAAIGADPRQPQEVARKVGINRNMAWKLSKIIQGNEPFAILNHLPGQPGVELVITAFSQAGAPEHSLERLRTATREFNDVLVRHAGDRDSFELTLESMGIFERESGSSNGREMAFRGNSMIWGVQVRTRLAACFLGPNRHDPSKADAAQIAALLGFQRLRPNARWRLFCQQLTDDSGDQIAATTIEGIETNKGAHELPMLFREFCSPEMPELDAVIVDGKREFFLPEGPVGKMAAFDCALGSIVRNLPMRQSEHNKWGSNAASIPLPVETLVLDLIVHRDLPPHDPPEVLIYGLPHGGMDLPANQSMQNLLPINATAVELPGQPPMLSTPLVPRYEQLAARIYSRMEWNPAEFRAMRVELAYPPMPSFVVLRWPLP